jgi:RNA polymerase sigma factor for flagellar operon FliA
VDQGATVERYLPLVGAIARTVSRGLPPSVEIDELMNDGVIGLIAAAQRYDPDRGVGFSTYAGHRIRGAMLDGLRERDPLPRTLRRMQKAAADGLLGPGCGIQFLELEHAASVPADDDAGPEALAMEADLRRRVWQGLEALPARDREVLVLRMVHALPLRVVAGRLSLSITRTAEIQARGVTRLRRFLDGEPMIRPRRRQDRRSAAPNRSRTVEPAALAPNPAPGAR